MQVFSVKYYTDTNINMPQTVANYRNTRRSCSLPGNSVRIFHSVAFS